MLLNELIYKGKDDPKRDLGGWLTSANQWLGGKSRDKQYWSKNIRAGKSFVGAYGKDPKQGYDTGIIGGAGSNLFRGPNKHAGQFHSIGAGDAAPVPLGPQTGPGLVNAPTGNAATTGVADVPAATPAVAVVPGTQDDPVGDAQFAPKPDTATAVAKLKPEPYRIPSEVTGMAGAGAPDSARDADPNAMTAKQEHMAKVDKKRADLADRLQGQRDTIAAHKDRQQARIDAVAGPAGSPNYQHDDSGVQDTTMASGVQHDDSGVLDTTLATGIQHDDSGVQDTTMASGVEYDPDGSMTDPDRFTGTQGTGGVSQQGVRTDRPLPDEVGGGRIDDVAPRVSGEQEFVPPGGVDADGNWVIDASAGDEQEYVPPGGYGADGKWHWDQEPTLDTGVLPGKDGERIPTAPPTSAIATAIARDTGDAGQDDTEDERGLGRQMSPAAIQGAINDNAKAVRSAERAASTPIDVLGSEQGLAQAQAVQPETKPDELEIIKKNAGIATGRGDTVEQPGHRENWTNWQKAADDAGKDINDWQKDADKFNNSPWEHVDFNKTNGVSLPVLKDVTNPIKMHEFKRYQQQYVSNLSSADKKKMEEIPQSWWEKNGDTATAVGLGTALLIAGVTLAPATLAMLGLGATAATLMNK